MNTHHQKASYRHTIPRNVSHFSCDSFTLPLVPKTHERPPRAAAAAGEKEGKPQAAPRMFKAVERVPFGWQASPVRFECRQESSLSCSQLDAIVPSRQGQQSALPVELEQLIAQSSDFYHCSAVNLADLLQPAFLNSFLRQGELL